MKRHKRYVALAIVLSIICIPLFLTCKTTITSNSQVAAWQEQFDLGLRFLREGNYQEAIIAFTAAIDIDPMQVLPYLRRAEAYIGAGETVENLSAAMEDYRTALRINPALTEAYLGLADIYIRHGNGNDAIEILRTGLQVADDTEAIQEKLSEIERGILRDSSGALRRRYIYDETGSLLRWHEYAYDAQGRETSVTSYDNEGAETNHIDFVYTSDGVRDTAYLDSADYEIVRHDSSIRNSEGTATIDFSYDQVVLNDAIPEFFAVNEDMRDIYERLGLDFANKSYYEELLENLEPPDDPFFDTVRSEVTYNANGYLSIRIIEQSYIEIFDDPHPYGINYNLYTGKRLNLDELTGVDNDSCLSYLRELIHRYRIINGIETPDGIDMLNNYIVNDFGYYVNQESEIVVCVPEFELTGYAHGYAEIPTGIFLGKIIELPESLSGIRATEYEQLGSEERYQVFNLVYTFRFLSNDEFDYICGWEQSDIAFSVEGTYRLENSVLFFKPARHYLLEDGYDEYLGYGQYLQEYPHESDEEEYRYDLRILGNAIQLIQLDRRGFLRGFDQDYRPGTVYTFSSDLPNIEQAAINANAIASYRQALLDSSWNERGLSGEKFAVFDMNSDGILEVAVETYVDRDDNVGAILYYSDGLRIESFGGIETLDAIDLSANRILMGRTRGKAIMTIWQLNPSVGFEELGSWFFPYLDEEETEMVLEQYFTGFYEPVFLEMNEYNINLYLSGDGMTTGYSVPWYAT